MASLQESLLNAMGTISEANINKQINTQTIECRVKGVIDPGIGLYQVEYMGNSFQVYSNNIDTMYSENEVVYVLVPSGDFSKKKFIIGSSVPSADNYYISEGNLLEVSENIFSQVTYNNKHLIELSTYHTEEKILNIENLSFDKVLLNYLKDYQVFNLSCNIKTDIPKEQQVGGNYGLKIEIPIIKTLSDGTEKEMFKTIIFDNSKIKGNPYSLVDWTLQDIAITFNSNEKYLISNNYKLSISAFVEGFSQLDNYNYDIWIDNISLKAAEYISEDKLTGYYLNIKSDSGNFFIVNGTTKKVLTPELRINGKETSYNNKECYWFLEDASIRPGSEYYNSIGGIGWKCLNERNNTTLNDNGVFVSEYVTNKYTYIVEKDNFESIRYKCVIIYSDTLVTGYITLTDLTQDISIKLLTNNDFNVIPKQGYGRIVCRVDLGTSGIDSNNLSYVWNRYDESGNFIDNDFYDILRTNELIENNTYETEIQFESNIIENINTISCTVYKGEIILVKDDYQILLDEDENPILDENGNIQYILHEVLKNSPISTKYVLLTVAEDSDYTISVKNGNVLYKYDANGNSPLLAEYDGPIGSRLTAIKPISFSIYDRYGKELSDDDYLRCKVNWILPTENTLLKFNSEDGIISSRGRDSLSYSIASTYNASKTNNSIILEIEIDNQTISTSIPLLFLKDGESGTNGTKYSAVITYNSGGKNWALGQLDDNGVHRNAKLIYFGNALVDYGGTGTIDTDPLKKWYVYTYTDDQQAKFKKLNANNALKFNVDVYKNGEKITNNSLYSIEWSWYDKNITSPCLILEDNKIIGGELWENYESTYCNILQAKVKITNNSADNFSDQYLYAYYPIEITRICNVAGLSLDDDILHYNGTVPTMDGGFYSVLYSSDGKDPKYDSSIPFKCLDSLAGDEYNCYTYTWDNTSSNLRVTTVDDNERGENENKEMSIKTTNQAKVKPIASWVNGDTKNYVRVSLNWDNITKQEYNKEYNEARIANAIDRAWVDFYRDVDESEGSAAIAKSGKEDLKYLLLDYYPDDLKMFLDNCHSLLDLRYKAINTTSALIDKLNEWKSYFDSKSNVGGYSYMTTYNDRFSKITAARQKLIEIGINDNEYLGLDAIKDLSSLTLQLSDNDKTKVTKAIGATAYDVIAKMATSFDELISQYNNYYNKFASGDMTLLEQALYFYLFYSSLGLLLEDMYFLKTPKEVKVDGEIVNNWDVVNPTWITNYHTLEEYINSLLTTNYSYDSINSNILDGLNTMLDFWSNKTENKISQQAENWFNTRLNNSKEKEKTSNNILNNIIFEGNVSEASIVHIRPILFRTNAYEFSNINAWDGNKIYLDGDGDGSYILAPQMGAGTKDEYNRFTGLVMGTRNLNNNSSGNEIGMYGYYQGEQTIQLDAKTGSAKFGRNGAGQINLDPTTDRALLYSGNYPIADLPGESIPSPTSQGMLIDLTTPEIKFGSGKFRIDKDGKLYASEATISGQISADLGKIGGWIIDDISLYSDTTKSNGRLTLSSATVDSHTQDFDGNVILYNNNYVEILNYYSSENVQYQNNESNNFRITDFRIISDDEHLSNYIVSSEYLPTKGNCYNYDPILKPNYFYPGTNYGDYIKFNKNINSKHYSGGFVSPLYKYDNEHDRYIIDKNGSYIKFVDTTIIVEEPELDENNEPTGYNIDVTYDIEDGYYPIIFSREEVEAEITYNEEKQIYCKFLENELYNNFYKIERGDYINEVWHTNLVSGESFKIIIDDNIYYSRMYNILSDGTGIYHYNGNYININDAYYKINNFYDFTRMEFEDRRINLNFYMTIKGEENKFLLSDFGYFADEDFWQSSRNGEMIHYIIDGIDNYSYLYKITTGCGIYSHEHSSFDNSEKGFYLGSKGLSLGKNIRFSNDLYNNEIRISTNGNYLDSKLYIGNEGISIDNNKIVLDVNTGKLTAKDAIIYSNSGKIAGFNYDSNKFTGYGLQINSSGNIKFNDMQITDGHITKNNGDFLVWRSEVQDYMEDKIKHVFTDSFPSSYAIDTVYFIRRENE